MSRREEIEMTSARSLLGRKQSADSDSDGEEDEFDEADEDDEVLIQEQKSVTLWEDILKSLYQARFTAPLLAILGVVFAYQLTIAPYRTDTPGVSTTNDMNELRHIRPMPSDETLKHIQGIMLRQDNQIEMPAPYGGSFNMRFVPVVDKHGTHELPDMFYEGVMFGISHGNSHNVEYSRDQPDLSYSSLWNELTTMKPTPTHVLRRTATCNETDWTERGVGVYFSYADLQKQGMLSSDKLQPWKRVYEDLLWTARKYKQIYIMVWYPHQFGAPETSPKEGRMHKYTNIIQMVIPTRTGMDGLKSTAAVWLMARNETAVKIPPKMIRLDERTMEVDSYVSVDSL